MKDRNWIEKKYNEIRKQQTRPYVFINMKIKRLRIINILNDHNYGDNIITSVYDVVKAFLNEDEYVAKVSSCAFHILMKAPIGISDEDLLRRFNDLDDKIEHAGNDQYLGVIFCGFGLFYMSEYDVDFHTGEYYAEIARSQCPESTHLQSHLSIYGHDFMDQNLAFATLRKDFFEAYHNGDITIYLQPKVNLRTGEVESAEALIRWIDKDKGIIPINDYLPVLEENGLTNLIDKLAFEKACQYTKEWYDKYHKKIKISVNISKTTFNYWIFFDEYKEIYELYKSPKDCLEIEFLESIVLNQVERVYEIVEEIKKFGITCSLDDFGSGFSSYSVLTNCRLDVLKVDRTLFQNIGNEKETAVVRHIIEIAQELNMKTVAEGIEDKAYVNYLKVLGCDYIQGFIFYKPMTIEEFEKRFVIGDEKVDIT